VCNEPFREDERFQIRENTADIWVCIANMSVQYADSGSLANKFSHDQMALKLLYLSTCCFADLRAAKMFEDFPDDVAFQAANDFSFAFSLVPRQRLWDQVV
jgi:hypothetical protein